MTHTKYFKRIAQGLDVDPLLELIDAKPELWKEITARQKFTKSVNCVFGLNVGLLDLGLILNLNLLFGFVVPLTLNGNFEGDGVVWVGVEGVVGVAMVCICCVLVLILN